MGFNYTIWAWNLSSKIFHMLQHFVLKLYLKSEVTWEYQFRHMMTCCFILCGLPNTVSVLKWGQINEKSRHETDPKLVVVSENSSVYPSIFQSPHKPSSKISFQYQKLRFVPCLFCSHDKKSGEIWNQTSSVTCRKWKCSWLSDDVTT